MKDRPPRKLGRNILPAGASLLLTLPVLFLPDWVQLLWPAFTALVLVFTTRRAALSLGIASLVALIVLWRVDRASFLSWFSGDGGLLGTLTSPWHAYALIFTLLLGAMSAVIEKSGGLSRFLQRTTNITERARRRFLKTVLGLGLLCFFDGLANALMLGRVARPVADRLRVSRAYLAYLVDTTSSAVACLAFLSTWVVTQLGYISVHSPLETAPYLQFLSSVPCNYYCLFGLFIAFLSIHHSWVIGPMRSREASVEDLAETSLAQHQPVSSNLRSALVPIAVLLLALPLSIFFLHRPPEALPFSERIQSALNASTVPLAFVIASGAALLAACFLSPGGPRWRTARTGLKGAWQLAPALGILLLAWILGSLFSELGTADVLSRALGDTFPLRFLPVGVFLVGCVMSFVSGTSWGTMGLLMPLALPLAGTMAGAQELPAEALSDLVPAVIGAVFGGAVFGDHCSPYSDTTIVSALASGVTTHEHTITQLPFALFAAVAAISLGYIPVAFGLTSWLALLAGGGVIAIIISLWSRKTRAPQ